MTVGSWATLVGVAATGAAAAGLVVALVIRRVHPASPFVRTWLFYAGLVAFLMAVVLVAGLT